MVLKNHISVIEEGSGVTPGRKRKLYFKSEACEDDVFESPVVKKLKEEDEIESDVVIMNLSLLSDMCQSHNLAYIQMENGDQQLCMINNGGVIGNNETTTIDISDGAVYSMSVPMMEATNNEVERMPYRHDILLLMLEMSMQCQPTQEEKDTGPSLEELLSQVNPSEFMCVYKIKIHTL